jgi:hypothetical protein
MDFTFYLDQFNKAGCRVNPDLLSKKQLEIKVGTWLESVALKAQKKNWVNDNELFQPGPSIFFSVWVNDATIKENKIFYNIHALKLRQLKNYSITSREFASAFRSNFKTFEKQWPNVSVDYGPLTLMEGWQKVDLDNFHYEIEVLVTRFMEIDYIIDDLLSKYKK